MKFKGDIVITDPCYIIEDDNDSDWDKCMYGGRMEGYHLWGLVLYNV